MAIWSTPIHLRAEHGHGMMIQRPYRNMLRRTSFDASPSCCSTSECPTSLLYKEAYTGPSYAKPIRHARQEQAHAVDPAIWRVCMAGAVTPTRERERRWVNLASDDQRQRRRRRQGRSECNRFRTRPPRRRRRIGACAVRSALRRSAHKVSKIWAQAVACGCIKGWR